MVAVCFQTLVSSYVFNLASIVLLIRTLSPSHLGLDLGHLPSHCGSHCLDQIVGVTIGLCGTHCTCSSQMCVNCAKNVSHLANMLINDIFVSESDG